MDYIEYKEYVQNIDSGYTSEPLYTPIILHKVACNGAFISCCLNR